MSINEKIVMKNHEDVTELNAMNMEALEAFCIRNHCSVIIEDGRIVGTV